VIQVSNVLLLINLNHHDVEDCMCLHGQSFSPLIINGNVAARLPPYLNKYLFYEDCRLYMGNDYAILNHIGAS
jgi:hypothetical protein